VHSKPTLEDPSDEQHTTSVVPSENETGEHETTTGSLNRIDMSLQKGAIAAVVEPETSKDSLAEGVTTASATGEANSNAG